MSRASTFASAVAAGALVAACYPVTPPSANRQLLASRGDSVGGVVTKGLLLGPFASLKDNCTTEASARIRILQQPMNGTLVTGVGQGVASYASNNSFARCNGSPITGAFASYTPNPGYRGQDGFRIEVTFPNGERRPFSARFVVAERE